MRARHSREDLLGNGCAEANPTGRNRPDGLQYGIAGCLFGDIATGTGIQGALGINCLIVCGEHQYRQTGELNFEIFD